VAIGEAPQVTRLAASGAPTVRILRYKGREIHRCEIRDARRPVV
jgi:hypothetical protein